MRSGVDGHTFVTMPRSRPVVYFGVCFFFLRLLANMSNQEHVDMCGAESMRKLQQLKPKLFLDDQTRGFLPSQILETDFAGLLVNDSTALIPFLVRAVQYLEERVARLEAAAAAAAASTTPAS